MNTYKIGSLEIMKEDWCNSIFDRDGAISVPLKDGWRLPTLIEMFYIMSINHFGIGNIHRYGYWVKNGRYPGDVSHTGVGMEDGVVISVGNRSGMIRLVRNI